MHPYGGGQRASACREQGPPEDAHPSQTLGEFAQELLLSFGEAATPRAPGPPAYGGLQLPESSALFDFHIAEWPGSQDSPGVGRLPGSSPSMNRLSSSPPFDPHLRGPVDDEQQGWESVSDASLEEGSPNAREASPGRAAAAAANGPATRTQTGALAPKTLLAGPKASRTRVYRDPEKRRLQNRMAARRARERARLKQVTESSEGAAPAGAVSGAAGSAGAAAACAAARAQAQRC